MQREQERDRVASDRFRLAVAALLGAIAVGSIALLIWLRGAVRRRRAAAIADERARVARDLHDTLLQGFSGLAMQLEAQSRIARRIDQAAISDRFASLAKQAGAALADARDAVWQLRSPEIEAGNLAQSLAHWHADLDPALRTKVTLAIDDVPSLNPERTSNILRVIQEAVRNADRHGGADAINVAITHTDNAINIRISDNGSGFVADDRASAAGQHWGITGMRERVSREGGNLTIDSAPGTGTRIAASVPIAS